MSITQASPPPAKKQRPPPQSTVVTAIEKVTPLVTRISVTGPDLAPFAQAKPGAHMKLFFPAGVWPPPEGVTNAPRPPSRTYTPRRFDAEKSRLEIEFVMHGAGIASDWAAKAVVGDRLLVSAGPGGGYPVPEGISNLVIIADDTALPAAGMVIEALPHTCHVNVICEIENAGEERVLSPIVASKPQWLHRAPGAAKPASLLQAAAASLSEQPVGTYYWIACEAAAMRSIRDNLFARAGVDRKRVHTRGYWKYGDTNYPDHDYGED